MRKIVILLLVVHVPVYAGTYAAKFQEDYYFQKKEDKEIDIGVVNPSPKLIFANAEIYEGLLKNGEVNFALESKVLNYDILPASLVLLPGQTKKIKLFRDAGANNSNSEEYYRVRILPKSPDMALKANPKLMDMLSVSEKESLADSSGVNASVNFFVGSGSVLIVQEGKLDFENVRLKLYKRDKGFTIDFENGCADTVEFKNARVFVAKRFFQIGTLIVRGGTTKKFIISPEALKENGMNDSEIFESVSFTDQYNQEHTIKLE